jgi:hypothetical protein
LTDPTPATTSPTTQPGTDPGSVAPAMVPAPVPASPVTPPPAPQAPSQPATGQPTDLGALGALHTQLQELTTRYEQARKDAELAQQHQQRAEQAEGQLARLTVGRAAGLPDAIADRLRGSSEQELTADAAALVAAIAAMTIPTATTPPGVPPAAVPGLPVEALRPASAVGTAGPAEDTPEQIGRLVWGT